MNKKQNGTQAEPRLFLRSLSKTREHQLGWPLATYEWYLLPVTTLTAIIRAPTLWMAGVDWIFYQKDKIEFWGRKVRESQ